MSKTGFHLAGDLVWIHGQRGGVRGQHRPPGGVEEAFKSLPAAVFILAYAAGDSLVTKASRQNSILGGTAGHMPLGLGGSGLVSTWSNHCQLMARTRVTPRGSTDIHPWRLLDGAELDAYLADARSLRNKLAHTGATESAPLRSQFFVKDGKSRLPVMTLMLAEGLLQAAQDIAYLTLGTAVPVASERAAWEWVLPEQSATGRMPESLWGHKAFPLPPRSALSVRTHSGRATGVPHEQNSESGAIQTHILAPHCRSIASQCTAWHGQTERGRVISSTAASSDTTSLRQARKASSRRLVSHVLGL